MPPRDAARNGMLVLSYLAFLGIIPLLLRKAEPEVRWHARNGLILFAAVILACVLATLIGVAVPAFSCLYAIVMFFVLILYTVIVILAVIKALEGKRLIVPGLSHYAGRR